MVAQGKLFDDISESLDCIMTGTSNLYIGAAAFAFSTLSTVRLYSGLMGSRTSSDKKEKRYLSISSMSLSAAVLGTVMVLPLLFPEVKSHKHDQPNVGIYVAVV